MSATKKLTPAQTTALALAARCMPGMCAAAPDGVVRALVAAGLGTRIRAGVFEINDAGRAAAK